MLREIFGKKLGMTQIFDEEGNLHATTLLEVEPVYAVEKVAYKSKTMVRIGCFKVDPKRVGKVRKPEAGYFKKNGMEPYKLLREVTTDKGSDLSFLEKARTEAPAEAPKAEGAQEAAAAKTEGTQEAAAAAPQREFGVEIFKEGDVVDVRAKTKGKGFAGGMKRHHWAGQPAAHGSMTHRRIGSVGSNTFPGRVIKGLRMAGHMGDAFRTTRNLKVLKVDREQNLIFIEGSVPGARGAVVKIIKVS